MLVCMNRSGRKGVVVVVAAEHGLPVMEIVLARSVCMLFFSAVTAAYQRHDPRGNRRLLLMARGCCGTLVCCPRHHLHLAPLRQCTLLLLLIQARMTFRSHREPARVAAVSYPDDRGLHGAEQGISMWYTALLLLPLTDVVVFGFLTPLVVALASSLAIKEVPSRCARPAHNA